MGAVGAGVDLHPNEVEATPRQNLDVGDQPRLDVIRDEIRESLFCLNRFLHADHSAGAVFHPDQDDPAGRIRKGDQSAEHSLWRR